MDAFTFAATPQIHFGVGKRTALAGIVASFGSRLLLVTGGSSFDRSALCVELLERLDEQFEVVRCRVSGEPTPAEIDAVVGQYGDWQPDCVVAVGGGSCIDAGKAIAGLLPSGDSVMDYLEGVGRGKRFSGPVTPFVAVPTTAGTGSETSKNAVLSVVGHDGFKKSFRHEKLVARHIVLDPELSCSCPPNITAACGMDAVTQLLESYVSRQASPITDALALSGLQRALHALPRAVADGTDLAARAEMLYAAAISGMTLANAGLGSVHGLASPIGAFFPMPHGEVCGTLLYEACRLNIALMQARDRDNPALAKYAQVGRLIASEQLDDDQARDVLLSTLHRWTRDFSMPQLSDYGVGEADISRLIEHASPGSMRTNPIALQQNEVAALIRARI